jgi:rhodanese-related sulfurtransferase
MDPHFDGVIFATHAEELARRIKFEYPPFAVLDVRQDRSGGSIEGSMPVSVKGLEEGLPEGTTDATEFIVVGADLDDGTVRAVSEQLRKNGAKRVVELAGGVKQWRDSGFGLVA